MDIVRSFLSDTSTGTVGDAPHRIDFEIEVDGREQEVTLTARCECGHDFELDFFSHPQDAFEAAGQLTCPEA